MLSETLEKQLNLMNPCKRYTVVAMGIDADDRVAYATNGNRSECLNIPGKCGCTHAEVNLLRKLPHPVKVFVSHSPCLDCAKELVRAGVQVVQFYVPYRLHEGIDYLERHGVQVKIG